MIDALATSPAEAGGDATSAELTRVWAPGASLMARAGRIRVLLIEPRRQLAAMLADYLDAQEFAVDVVVCAPDAVKLVRDIDPDVIVMGASCADTQGAAVARQLRTLSDSHLVVLTDDDAQLDSVRRPSAADGRATQSHDLAQVVNRIRGALRRPETVGAETAGDSTASAARYLNVGALQIDLAARRVQVNDEPVSLTRTEFDVLAMLVSRLGEVVSRRELHDALWGLSWVGNRNTLDVHVGNLRRKLGDDPNDPRYVLTVRGVGFRLRL